MEIETLTYMFCLNSWYFQVGHKVSRTLLVYTHIYICLHDIFTMFISTLVYLQLDMLFMVLKLEKKLNILVYVHSV